MLEKVYIDPSKCVGCGACIAICPAQAIKMLSGMLSGWVNFVDQRKCVGCGKCVELCHKKAPRLNQ